MGGKQQIHMDIWGEILDTEDSKSGEIEREREFKNYLLGKLFTVQEMGAQEAQTPPLCNIYM